jgi:uncharacterized protein YbaP (TraB family)
VLGYRIEHTPVVMIGSIHALPEEWAENLRAVLRTLLAPVSCLMVEVDLDAPFDRSVVNLPAGTSLYDVIEPDLLRQVLLLADSLGVDESQIINWKPWYVPLHLVFRQLELAGYVHACSIDRIVVDLAIEASERIKLRPLESPDYALRSFDKASHQRQWEYIRLFMERHEQGILEFESILRGWATADEGLLETILESRLRLLPDVIESLILERNRLWMPMIESLLSEHRPALIVVGALHFVGAEGLPALLRGAGHSVEPLWRRESA